MIEIITRDNAHHYRDVLDDMFEMRYNVAVEQWHWDIPVEVPGIDKDAFDTDRTIYFVKRNDVGKVIGCARLNPTTHPHMLTEVFSEHCNFRTPPEDPATYELSRFFVDKTQSSRIEFVLTIWELLAAVAEFCLDVGIKNLSWYAYQLTYNTSLEVWKTKPLGTPQRHPNDVSVYVPAISPMDEEAVRKTKAKARLAGRAWFFVVPKSKATPVEQLINTVRNDARQH